MKKKEIQSLKSPRKEKHLKSELSNVLNLRRRDEQKVANYQVPTFMNENGLLFHNF